MLVLTRKTDQEVVIAGNVRVKVHSIHGNQVRLGIEAPEKISIRRTAVPACGQVLSNTIVCSATSGQSGELPVQYL